MRGPTKAGCVERRQRRRRPHGGEQQIQSLPETQNQDKNLRVVEAVMAAESRKSRAPKRARKVHDGAVGVFMACRLPHLTYSHGRGGEGSRRFRGYPSPFHFRQGKRYRRQAFGARRRGVRDETARIDRTLSNGFPGPTAKALCQRLSGPVRPLPPPPVEKSEHIDRPASPSPSRQLRRRFHDKLMMWRTRVEFLKGPTAVVRAATTRGCRRGAVAQEYQKKRKYLRRTALLC